MFERVILKIKRWTFFGHSVLWWCANLIDRTCQYYATPWSAWGGDRRLWSERLWEKEGFKTRIDNATRNVNKQSRMRAISLWREGGQWLHGSGCSAGLEGHAWNWQLWLRYCCINVARYWARSWWTDVHPLALTVRDETAFVDELVAVTTDQILHG